MYKRQHCEGTGLVRTASSAALSALRLLEEEAAKGNGNRLSLRASQEATIYVLNRKRAELAEIEERYGVSIDIFPDSETEGARMVVEASGPPPAFRPKIEPLVIEDDDDLDVIEDIEDEEEEAVEAEGHGRESRSDSDARRKRSRRRRGRRGRREDGDERPAAEESTGAAVEGEVAQPQQEAGAEEGEDEGQRRRGRRGRRGGRGRRGDRPEGANEAVGETVSDGGAGEPLPDVTGAGAEEAPKKPRRRSAKPKVEDAAPAETVVEAEVPAEKPRRTRKKAETKAETEVVPEAGPEPAVEPAPVEPETAKPKRARKPKAEAASAATALVAEPAMMGDGDDEGDGGPRRGWWQRTFGPES